TKLAKTLARAGVPSLVFDYFGCGDSLGDGGDVRPGRWQDDIESARAELAVRTGAARYVAVGVRLGGLLLAATLPRLDFARVVLWDPVESGASHLEALAREHRRYLKSLAPLRLLPWPRKRPPAGEWLGITFPEPVRRELAELSLKPLLVGRSEPVFVAEQRECRWEDPTFLEDVIADTGISAALAELVTRQP
ncbi:MAG TPA: hypothetical protein VGK73_28445, partial [Polyangiaceae bacterium]